jgi:Ig-like domain CHU_C associated/Secretion system C-terminal sorting domain
MKKFYSFISLILVSFISFAQLPTLPLDFESATVNYAFTDFDGGATTKIANPQINGINTSANVAKMIKSSGQVWGGSWIQMAAAIDFTVNKTFKVKVFSPRIGAKLLLKVENSTNPAINFEKEATSTVANAWEELTFDYSTINTANQYHRLVFIFDNGTMGNGTANYTWLFDDVRLTTTSSPTNLPVLPLDFESATVNYAFTDFDGGATTKIANPQINAINTSANVAKMIKSSGQVWGGSWIQLAAPINFTVNKIFKVKVYSPRVGAKLLLKVENATDGNINFEKEATSTIANAWEELTFDYTTISTINQYSKLVFIFDNGTMGNGTANFTFLFDDVRLTTSGSPTLTQMNLPVTFDDATVNYGLVGFGGAEQSTIVTDPTLATNKVAKVIKTNTAELWAGTTVTALSGVVQTGFATNIPFTATEKRMNVKVWSPHAGISVKLKVEDKADPTKSVETDATVTLASGWQTLEFNFANQSAGTAAFNLATSYNKVSIFFNFGVTGATAGERIYYFDDVKFGPAATPSTLPILPLTFESATLNYTFTDFDGGTTLKIANPQINGINTSANVAKMIKGAGAVWAGSWIQLATPIDFSVNKVFKVKVFSPRVGAKLLLKVESSTNTALNFEKEATSTVANAWEELVFDYSTVSTTSNFDRLVFIFDLGTAGNGSANFTWLFDDIILTSLNGGLSQMNVPVTFDDASVNYGLVGFGGAEQSTIVTDPTLATNKVAKVIKTNTAELWAGTTITALIGSSQTSFANAIPFTASERRMNVRVWSPHTNIKVRLKVEDKTDPTKSCETEATFTGAANTWQTLEFNFNNQATGTAPFNPAFTFNKASIFFNFGVTGATAGERIYYFDDVKFGGSGAAPLLPVLPLDFESASINYTFTDFDGGATTKIANTQINGINTSATVAKMVKNAGQVWGGSWIQLAGPIDFSVNKTFKVKVFSPRVGAKLLLKVENATDGNINFEKEATTTVANSWEDLTFDYSTISTTNQYSKLVFIFDLGTMGNGTANYTWLFDDVRLITAAPVLTQMNLPVTFDATTVNYGLVGFGGAEQSTIVTDPTLATNKVAKVIKTNTAELWAGTTITALSGVTQTGFGSNIPFTFCSTKMSVRVWSPHSGIKVRLKVEDKNDPTKSCETETTVTTANGWQTLDFDFANQASGTAPLNVAFNLNKASIFFNFGVTGASAGERIYYFDDVKFVPGANPVAPIVTTPINYCQNATATPLNAIPTTGNVLKWYTAATGGTALATVPTPSTATLGSTTYYVSQGTTFGCESPRVALVVNVNTVAAAPIVTTSVVYCQNATAQLLDATAINGNTLNWYTVATGGTASTTIPLPTTTLAGTTNYYVSQNNGFGCESARSLITVTVNALPNVPTLTAAPYTKLVPGLTTTITATNIGTGNTYQWFKNGIQVVGQGSNSITLDINNIGSYVLKTTNGSGCNTSSNAIVIDASSSNNLFVYPNPTNGKFQVRYFSDINNLKPRKLVIYDDKGALTYTANYAMFEAYTPMNINLSNHAAGIYTIYLLDNEGKKLISSKVFISK